MLLSTATIANIGHALLEVLDWQKILYWFHITWPVCGNCWI